MVLLVQQVLVAALAAAEVVRLTIVVLYGALVQEAGAVRVFLVKDQTGLEEAGPMLLEVV
jgi:hypothetical protein